MKTRSFFSSCFALIVMLLVSPVTAKAEGLPDHVLGKANAPVTVIEYASLTCSHCADFYAKVMPEIEKKYVDTGKVRFIYRDFPLDSVGLRASALAHCMPDEQFYPFVKILFNNYASWIKNLKFQDVLIKYAEMSGMPTEKAKTCIEDSKMMDAIIARQKEAMEKYKVKATPTFIIGDDAEVVMGAQTVEAFSAILDKHLANK